MSIEEIILDCSRDFAKKVICTQVGCNRSVQHYPNYREWGIDLPVSLAVSEHCVSVDSKRGWQRFNLPGSFTKITNISGNWTVDARSYSPVSYSGHSGRDAQALAPYNQYKFDQRFPFGALLMGSGQGVLSIQGSTSFNGSFGAVDMRINDADNALGDNQGSLNVCFGK
jgi:hypothetical protein